MLGSLDITEGLDDLRRRVGLEQLQAADQHAGFIGIQYVLKQGAHLGLDQSAVRRQDPLDRAATNDLTHRAFGHDPDGALRVLDVENEILGAGWVDLPLYLECDIDDIAVTGQHQAVFSALPLHLLPALVDQQGRADFHAVDLGDARLDHAANRGWPVPVKAGRRLGGVLAEHRLDADFIGSDSEETGRQPAEHGQKADQHSALGAYATTGSAGHNVLQPVLTLAQDGFKIGWAALRARWTAAATPWASAIAATAAAAIAPGTTPAAAAAAASPAWIAPGPEKPPLLSSCCGCASRRTTSL
jgi:hypothetical protein